MRNLLTFSIWMRFHENIQNKKVVCMAAWKAGKNDFWLQLQRKFKKKNSRRASTAGVATFSASAFHQSSGSFATLSQVATNP
jgi:hypothetical protein